LPKAHETNITKFPESIVEPKPAATPQTMEPLTGQDLWAQVCKIAANSTANAAKVDNLSLKTFDGRTLRLAINTTDTGLAKILSSQTKELSALVLEATGHRVEVQIEALPANAINPSTGQAQQLAFVKQMPLIQKAVQIFNADVVSVCDSVHTKPKQAESPGS